MKRFLVAACAALALAGAAQAEPQASEPATLEALARDFQTPPMTYRPIAAYQVDVMPPDLPAQIETAFRERGYGSFLFAPSADPTRKPGPMTLGQRKYGLQNTYPPYASKWLPKALPNEEGFGSMVRGRPRTPTPLTESPGYFTDAWFDRVEAALDVAKRHGAKATFYDEVGFPTGMANHTAPVELHRKVLRRYQAAAQTDGSLRLPPLPGVVQAVIAIEDKTRRRIDLTSRLTAEGLIWRPPSAGWRLEGYSLETAKSTGSSVDYNGAIDYMDPKAVGWFIDQTYERLTPRLKPYFGSVINMTFFDDVGVFPDEKTWSTGMNARFKAITGREPATYYPALWEDIGPETAAARVGFFRARSDLLSEGFPKLVTDWTRKHGLQSSGHAPGQYDPQPTDMLGDAFKFYRHVDVPMVDAIFGHGYGRDGFKLVSSEASVSDKPIVVAENFTAGGDANGYRRTIELFVRGVTRFISADRSLYDPPIGGPADFGDWIGRSSLLLQGGRHVADVAIVYPIDALQAFYSFDAPGNAPPLPNGNYISNDHDYLAVGEMLLDGLHRDFTFLHPEDMAGRKLKVSDGRLVLDNKVNRESYSLVILPGGEVLSVGAARKLKAFYDGGGAVLATSRLPYRSAEFGRDAEVRRIISQIFGVDPANRLEGDLAVRRNRAGGRAMFLREPDERSLDAALDGLQILPDVDIEPDPTPPADGGVFSYIHKTRGPAEVYFFGNSSVEPVETAVAVRGRLRLESWDPHTGARRPVSDAAYVQREGTTYTRTRIRVDGLRSLFLVGEPEPASSR